MSGFRRVLKYLWPHARYLTIAVPAAVGVVLFYTASISTILPILKVLLAENETLPDWIHRSVAEQRLGFRTAGDMPPDQQGLPVVLVQPGGPLAEVRPGDRIVGLGEGAESVYGLLGRLARAPSEQSCTLDLQTPGGEQRQVVCQPGPLRWHQRLLLAGVRLFPAGREASARLSGLILVMSTVVVLTILSGFMRFLHAYIMEIIVQRAMLDLRVDVYHHLLRMPVGFYSQREAGDVLGRFAQDSTVCEMGLHTLFGKALVEPLKAVGLLALTLLLNPGLMIVALIVVPTAACLVTFFGRRIKRAQSRALKAWGKLIGMLSERMEGLWLIKTFGAERRETLRLLRAHRRLTGQQLAIARFDAAMSPALQLLATLVIAVFVILGGYQVFSHQIGAEKFLTSVICLGAMLEPIRRLSNVTTRMQRANAAAERLFEVLDLPAERDPAPDEGGFDLSPLSGSIEFREVWFAYENRPDTPVLRGVNMRVRAGERLAIVGPNGAGKTTLMALLLRFYDPQGGQVLFDGQDIRNARLRSLRRQFGLVTQDTVIFSDSLKGNVGLALRAASENQLKEAIRAAHAEDLLTRDTPDPGAGWEQQISSRTLSGGQKQRLAIARAILPDPAILILDEATSQIDAESELKIRQAVQEVMRGRTTFIIAHRYSSIAQVDRVVVMDGGRVVATGRHDELLRECDLYRRLYETQFPDRVEEPAEGYAHAGVPTP